MKYIYTLLIALLIPQVSFAAPTNNTTYTSIGTTTSGWFNATSTTKASTFPLASTTAISSTGSAWFATDGGKVGIGTTSPGQMLSVAGDILGNNIIGQYFTATSSTATSTFAGSATFGGNLAILGNDKYIALRNGAINILDNSGNTRYEANGDVDLRFDKDNSGNAGDGFNVQDGSGATYLNIDNSGNMSVYKSGGTGSYFDYATGNVGIGTTTPNSLLDIAGATPTLTISDTTASIGSGGTYGNLDFYASDTSQAGVMGRIRSLASPGSFGNAGELAFWTYNSSGGIAERMRITTAGNVGIGTTTPSTLLNLYGSAPIIKIANSNSGNIAGLNIDYLGLNKAVFTANMATGEVKIGGSTNGYFPTFYSHGSEVMRIGTSGNVGIGTTTPYAKLSITNTGSDPSFVVEDSTSPDTTPFIIDSAGLVGIGTSTLTYTLNVQGTSNFVGTTYFHPTTDPTNTSRGVSITPSGTGISTLDVWGNSGGGLQIKGWSTGSGISTAQIFINPSTSGMNPYIDFLTGVSAASSRMRILDTGFVGIGTTTPYTALGVMGQVVMTNFFATSTTATSTIAGGLTVQGITSNPAIEYDLSTTMVTMPNVTLGGLQFAPDSGLVTLADMPVTSDTADGTTTGYGFNLNGTSQLFISGLGDGLGYLRQVGVGIGTTSPMAKLAILLGTTTDPLLAFAIASTTSTFATSTLFSIDNRGSVDIGTSTTNTNILNTFTTGTTTISVDSNSLTQGSCLELKDSDGTGYTYITVNNGVLTASATSCK